MAIIRSWAGAGVADGPLTTATTGTGDVAFDAVYNSVSVAGGRIKIANDGLVSQCRWVGLNLSGYGVRAYVSLDSLPTVVVAIMHAQTADTTQLWRVTVSVAGTLQLRDSAQLNVAESPAMTLGQAYRVEVVVNGSATTLSVYDQVETLFYTKTVNLTAGTLEQVQFGKTNGPAFGPLYFDDLAIGNTASAIGPKTGGAPPPTLPAGTIAMIGDSLTYQDGNGVTNITNKLVAAGWQAGNISVYGCIGKRISTADSNGKTTVQNIADARAQLGEPALWVIALGTNGRADPDTTTTSNVTQVMDAIGAGKKVLWIGVGLMSSTDADSLRRNQAIIAALTNYPGAVYADWNGYVHNGRDESGLWNVNDGIHMTPNGYALRNTFMVEQVTSMPGDGAATAQYFSDVRLGSRSVDAVYKGSTLLWQRPT